jgi:hypothetical protein
MWLHQRRSAIVATVETSEQQPNNVPAARQSNWLAKAVRRRTSDHGICFNRKRQLALRSILGM